MSRFFFVPLSCLAAPDPEVIATNRPLNMWFLLVPEAWMICYLHFPPQPLELLFPRPLPSLNVSRGLKILLILLIMQRTLRSEAWPDLIHILETLLCLSEKVTRDEDRESVTYFFIISPIASAKHDFSLLITLSMKRKCFPKDLALAVVRKARDLFKTLINSLRKWFQFFKTIIDFQTALTVHKCYVALFYKYQQQGGTKPAPRLAVCLILSSASPI